MKHLVALFALVALVGQDRPYSGENLHPIPATQFRILHVDGYEVRDFARYFVIVDARSAEQQKDKPRLLLVRFQIGDQRFEIVPRAWRNLHGEHIPIPLEFTTRDVRNLKVAQLP